MRRYLHVYYTENSPGVGWGWEYRHWALPSLVWQAGQEQGHAWRKPLVSAGCWNNWCEISPLPFARQKVSPRVSWSADTTPSLTQEAWALCKLCYIISLRMTGGEIWAPVVLFHWYRLEGSSKVGHASLRASPAGRGSASELLERGLCTSAKSGAQRLNREHGARPGLRGSARESLSHSSHHWLGQGSKSWQAAFDFPATCFSHNESKFEFISFWEKRQKLLRDRQRYRRGCHKREWCEFPSVLIFLLVSASPPPPYLTQHNVKATWPNVTLALFSRAFCLFLLQHSATVLAHAIWAPKARIRIPRLPTLQGWHL